MILPIIAFSGLILTYVSAFYQEYFGDTDVDRLSGKEYIFDYISIAQ
jgi:hypothetical protein